MAKFFAIIFAVIGILISLSALSCYLTLNELATTGAQFNLKSHWLLGPLTQDMVAKIARDPSPNIDAAVFVSQIFRRIYLLAALGLAILAVSTTILLRKRKDEEGSGKE